jgi:hypothetical protein
MAVRVRSERETINAIESSVEAAGGEAVNPVESGLLVVADNFDTGGTGRDKPSEPSLSHWLFEEFNPIKPEHPDSPTRAMQPKRISVALVEYFVAFRCMVKPYAGPKFRLCDGSIQCLLGAIR